MSDLVTRLRRMSDMTTTGNDLADISRAADEIERLRKGIQEFLDGRYNNPRTYRPNKCPHDQYWYQGCEKCDEEHFASLLSSDQ